MKEWTVEVYVLDQDGKEKAARCFTKVVYHLHPSFDNPVQSKSSLGLAPLSPRRAATDRYPDSLHRAAVQVH